jgi:Ca2+-transporting ATPase
MPPILYPVHLAFLELIIDPVCSIAFEAEPGEPAITKRPPRSASEHLFSRAIIFGGATKGLVVLAAALLVHFFLRQLGEDTDHARAVAFTTLIFANVCLILSLRSRTEPAWVFLRRPNLTLGWITLSLVTLSGLVLFTPAIATIFQFSSPHWDDVLASLLVAVVSLAGFEIAKAMRPLVGERH